MAVTKAHIQWIGLIAGPVLAVVVYMVLPHSYAGSDGPDTPFTQAGRITAALALWIAIWWMTEAISIYATALLPLAVLPASGAMPIRQAAAPYANELIYLFMGGFMLALAMQRWGLHRRFALTVLRYVGSRPDRLIGGFMVVTAILSMWVSNTATTIMMLPIALSIIELAKRSSEYQSTEDDNFTPCLLLAIAYSASIGGIGTLIGTPPNLFLASYIKDNLNQEISFVRWMGVGIPLVVVFLPLVWLIMTRKIFPVRRTHVEGDRLTRSQAAHDLGAMSRGEWSILAVFLVTVFAWIFRPLLASVEILGAKPLGGLSDPGIAIMAALALFVVPVDVQKRVFIIDWDTAKKLPWEVLVLFGGGLSLAAAIRVNGVGEFLGNQVGALAGIPDIFFVVIVIAMLIYLTELTSNTATTATLIPILASLAPGLGFHPYMLIVPAAIAASCAFMLPVATPPNAIVFGSGQVTMQQMIHAGLWLNIIGIVVITVVAYTVMIYVLGIQ